MIAEALDAKGHRVWHAKSGKEARALVGEVLPDLVILDLILPDTDGLFLCAELKERADVPVIICSGTKRKRDALLGMKICADDFVPKPFDVEELEVRVEAVLRRTRARPRAPPPAGQDEPPADDIERFGSLVLDPTRRSALLRGQAVALTPTEYRLLSVFVRRAGEVLSRADLEQLVWGYQGVGLGRSIDSHVSHLRSKLERAGGPDERAPAIVSVRGLGYSLVEGGDASDGAATGDPGDGQRVR